MSELPPDPPRLRAILAHLDQQLATNQAVGIYLGIQRKAVQRALASAEHQGTGTPHPTVAAPQESPLPQPGRAKLRPDTYTLEPKSNPRSPDPPLIHVGGCEKAGWNVAECSARQAELALTQKELVGAAPCPHCRPDNALGLP